MLPTLIDTDVVLNRLAWIQTMTQEIRQLPLTSEEAFMADSRNIWTAESCLRRALEALLDLGRHILAKGLAVSTAEYKQIAQELGKHGILDNAASYKLRLLAGYRNRLTHYYHEVTPEELFNVCAHDLADIEAIANQIRHWLNQHPHLLSQSLT
jgi:uncharacterized protein YutE (UPF0331/DUF86 family)